MSQAVVSQFGQHVSELADRACEAYGGPCKALDAFTHKPRLSKQETAVACALLSESYFLRYGEAL